MLRELTRIALTGVLCLIACMSGTAGDVQLGVYYFPGWSDEEAWYPIRAYPGCFRPLFGFYREGAPEVAEQHIRWAADYGIDFFAFDYYFDDGRQMHEAALDEGFLRAPSIGKTRFCLHWCNHPGIVSTTPREVEAFAERFAERYAAHPSYLRVDNRAVLILLVPTEWLDTLGVEGTKAAVDVLDRRCREAGLDGVYLVGNVDALGSVERVAVCRDAGFRMFAHYNYPFAGVDYSPDRGGRATYDHLMDQARALWDHWLRATDGDFWPSVMTGWDRRPWLRDKAWVRTEGTAEKFGRLLREGMMRARAKPPVVLIEAWNEWGEGSVLEPSDKYAFAYLEQVAAVKGLPAPATSAATPSYPTFDVELPRVDRWGFNRHAEGWQPGGIEDFRARNGALHGTSSTGDPTLVSPNTYLPCEAYDRLRLRLRASCADASLVETTGSVYLEFVDRTISEETALHFRVPLDDAWHVIDLALGEWPAWSGMTQRLRVDPVSAPGVTFDLDQVRFVPRGEP